MHAKPDPEATESETFKQLHKLRNSSLPGCQGNNPKTSIQAETNANANDVRTSDTS